MRREAEQARGLEQEKAALRGKLTYITEHSPFGSKLQEPFKHAVFDAIVTLHGQDRKKLLDTASTVHTEYIQLQTRNNLPHTMELDPQWYRRIQAINGLGDLRTEITETLVQKRFLEICLSQDERSPLAASYSDLEKTMTLCKLLTRLHVKREGKSLPVQTVAIAIPNIL